MTFRRLFLFSLLPLLPLGLVGCDLAGLDDSGPSPADGVYVANQGNFGDGNGSVTVYDPADQTAQPEAISGLGSIVQGVALRDTSLLVMANTGARVDLFSTNGPTQTGQVTGFNSPRYATFTDETTAYITDQSPFGSSASPAVRILNVNGAQSQVVDSIPVSGNPEGIAVSEPTDRAFAALGAFGASTLVAVLNTSQNTLDREVDIGCAPRDVVADNDGDVFALCSDAASAVILDAGSGTVDTTLALPDTAESASGVGDPASYDADSEELYIASDSGIIRVNTASNTVEATVNVGLSRTPGAVGYDSGDGVLYVARLNPSSPFTSAGTVTIHERDGTQMGSFGAGIAPTYIAFR
ncbi:MAG: hypothetical protein BRD55_00515 [Bacteroidetes bacterium SW_9_63_38]|nr:MAG: hypothetical protein BRD55_00515 [Bacteroidetes bacterium SW_9_63_38]